MKLEILIISDIHGDYEDLYEITKKETFDQIVILGDLFSYGFSDNKDKIINLLQKYKNKLILIKGNCDSLINYEAYTLQKYDVITLPFNNHLVTFTHGDKYSKGFLPSYHGDIFMSGHTHIPMLIKEHEIIYCNPGSLGKPRGGSSKGYIIYEDDKIMLKNINNNIIKELYLN